MRAPGLLVWTLFFVMIALVVVFGVGQRAPSFVIAGWVAVATLLLLALLLYADGGAGLTRVWRFGPGRIAREVRLPLPARLLPRDYPHVDEFEIVHALWTKGIFGRSLHGGHQDTLRFGTRASSRQISVIARGMNYSSATLRGADFSQHHADEIEREILPDVLAVAALAAAKVGVPLYVIEATYYVGSDTDG